MSILGKLTIQQTEALHVSRDFIHDTAELQFKNTEAVDALIRDLEALKENMLVLEGVKL